MLGRKPKRSTEIFTNGDFNQLYHQLHDAMEEHTLKPQDYEQKVKLLEELPLDPYQVLCLKSGKGVTKDKINEAFLDIVECLDTFESLWRPERNHYILGLPTDLKGDDWSERHAKFYHLVMMVLLKRAHKARELLMLELSDRFGQL